MLTGAPPARCRGPPRAASARAARSAASSASRRACSSASRRACSSASRRACSSASWRARSSSSRKRPASWPTTSPIASTTTRHARMPSSLPGIGKATGSGSTLESTSAMIGRFRRAASRTAISSVFRSTMNTASGTRCGVASRAWRSAVWPARRARGFQVEGRDPVRVRARRPRLLAISASLEPSSRTARSSRAGQLVGSSRPRLSRSRPRARRSAARRCPTARSRPAPATARAGAGRGRPARATDRPDRARRSRRRRTSPGGGRRARPRPAPGRRRGLGDGRELEAPGAAPLEVDLGVGPAPPHQRDEGLLVRGVRRSRGHRPAPRHDLHSLQPQRRSGRPHRELLAALGAPAGARRPGLAGPRRPRGSAGRPPGRAARRGPRSRRGRRAGCAGRTAGGG